MLAWEGQGFKLGRVPIVEVAVLKLMLKVGGASRCNGSWQGLDRGSSNGGSGVHCGGINRNY